MSKFGDAFSGARKAGKKTFTFGGKSYNTKTKEESAPTPRQRPKDKVAPKPRPKPITKNTSSKPSVRTNSGRGPKGYRTGGGF